MAEIPDAWPPDSELPRKRIAPLFPLPNVFLFPSAILPLNIYEPRYKAMIGDLLDADGRLVIGTVLEEATDERTGSLPVHAIGGLGEIGRHDKQDDGRFVIWLVGLARVRIKEVESDRPYRRVEDEILEEQSPSDEATPGLTVRLREAIGERGEDDLPENVPVGVLTDLLLQRIDMPSSVMKDLYSELSVESRAEAALEEHGKRPVPPKAPDED